MWGTDGAPAYANHPNGFPGSDASGGGILNDSPVTLFVTACVFDGCKVKAGNGSNAYAPVPDTSGALGNGGLGGRATGGAIDNAGVVFLRDCTFMQNYAVGGNGGDAHNGGVGGHGGDAYGGALQDELSNSDVSVVNCTFTANEAMGGNGGRGGDAWVLTPIPAAGGPGGGGGSPAGGALSILEGCPDATWPGIVHSTLYRNIGAVGSGGAGGVGLLGGANGMAGDNGLAVGCNLYFAGAGFGFVPMADTIVATGLLQPPAASVLGPDIRGPIASHGHNLIGLTDGSSGWMATDLQGTVLGGSIDPLLGPLQYNDLGPTPTLAPLACSPAIDAGMKEAIPLDQIGHVRPVVVHRIVNGGDGSDIGAYELQAFPAFPSLSYTFTPGVLTLSWPATTSTACFVLQQAPDLLPTSWVDYTGPVILVGGQYRVTITPLVGSRFYRLVYP